MRCVSKEVFIPFTDGRSVFPGFVTYASLEEDVLIHRSGWEDYSDAYDDFADRTSCDNGQTWSEPVMRQQSRDVPEGRLRYAENAALLDPDTGKLLTFVSRALYPKDQLDFHAKWEIVFNSYNHRTGRWEREQVLDLHATRSVGISFSFPIKTSRGKIIVPSYTLMLDDQGRPVHYKDYEAPLDQAWAIIGEYAADGQLQWRLGEPTSVDMEKTSRGYNENAIVELRDGRLAMVMRGDNLMYPDRPGYKWVCFSRDEAVTWSSPEPLGCTEGEPIESASNGSALFRANKTEKLYFIGNLCIHGRRAHGNFPRTPLVIAEVCEKPFSIKRETIVVIDQQQQGESDMVQMSNFRFYEDRRTTELVLFLTRYAERDTKRWWDADYYRYRVSLA